MTTDGAKVIPWGQRMPEISEAVESVPKAAGNFLTHKLGPLPVWGWGLIAGGGVAAYLYYTNSQSASGGLSPGLLNAMGVGAPAGGGGSFSGGSSDPGITSPTSPLASILTNSQWLQNVLNSSASAAGVSLQQAQMYLSDFLNGTPPNLSGQNETNYQAVINAALGLGGQPPQAISASSNNANPFSSMTTWLNEITAFLPSGSTGGESQQQIASALTNLVNGVSTTLTQAEADALAQAQLIVGSGPNPLSFTISKVLAPVALPGAGSGTVPISPLPPVVTPPASAPPASAPPPTSSPEAPSWLASMWNGFASMQYDPTMSTSVAYFQKVLPGFSQSQALSLSNSLNAFMKTSAFGGQATGDYNNPISVSSMQNLVNRAWAGH
jgi:hypothetical protein